MEKLFQGTPTEMTEFDDIMVWGYIKEIKIYDVWFQILFEAGIGIDVTRKNVK